ncbi:hypothetical protein CEXT_122321 [Caerostris extrusa]|uniref:Uncharacterized protein n=1 Tax=Caerostris extrusa TaxID=172846 RepID=A0AAV4XXV2_CAEEX|nr:hypothetical protein CEXT_122321 [Caerostris extrusa]
MICFTTHLDRVSVEVRLLQRKALKAPPLIRAAAKWGVVPEKVLGNWTDVDDVVINISVEGEDTLSTFVSGALKLGAL